MIHQINPDEDEGNMEVGRAIHESSYTRWKSEVAIPGMKIDRVFTEGKKTVIAEVKKSSRFKNSATMQLAFYLLCLREAGIDAKGKLLFPKERKEVEVVLTDEISKELTSTVAEIKEIVSSPEPIKAVKIGYCKKCAYRELCWS